MVPKLWVFCIPYPRQILFIIRRIGDRNEWRKMVVSVVVEVKKIIKE
jgi:hypothetical protein